MALLVMVVMAWEYTPALQGGFVYEDAAMTDACPPVSWMWDLHPRTVTVASWCAQLTQPSIARHAGNFGLHLLVTALVGALIWTVTQAEAPTMLVTAFFGVNAVHVESVAYLTGRSELIAAVGVLGACLAALHRRWWIIVPLLLLGWAGKESAAIGIVIVPLCLWYARGRAWAWVAAGAGVLLGLVILWRTVAWWPAGLSRAAWALLQTSAIARVLTLAVLPFGQTVDYDYARVPLALQVFAVVMLMAGLVWVAWQRSRLLVFGAAWVVCAVAPRLLVPTPRSVFPEHQVYLPLVGMALILAGLLTKESYGHYRPAL